METFLYYLLRASVLMVLFYGFYKLFFSRNTFHNLNRILLSGILLLVFVLPVFHVELLLQLEREPLPAETMTMDMLQFPVAETGSALSYPRVEIPWVSILTVLFAAGFLFVSIRYLAGLYQLVRIIRRSEKRPLGGDSFLCITDKEVSPFSWMKYIVLSPSNPSANEEAIIHHEQAHVRLHHSLDMIVADLFTCLFWFNPFSWLLRREIQSVHEFQADEQVLSQGIDTKQYQLLLIRKSVGEHVFALANNLYRCDLHKRIRMMMKNKTHNRMKWSYAAGLPLLALALTILSVPELNANILTDNDKTTEKEKGQTTVTEPVIDEPGQPIAGAAVMNPEAKTGAVADSFIIGDKKTEITDSIPGLKVVRKENNNDVKVIGYGKMEEGTPAKGMQIRAMDGKAPLYVIDGLKMPKDFETGTIRPEDIESISILKNTTSSDLYGEEGKNGVVLITTKSNRINPFGKKKPVILFDGEPISQEEMSRIEPANIASMHVYKGQDAIDRHGSKAKEGLVEIISKEAVTGRIQPEEEKTRTVHISGLRHLPIGKRPLIIVDDERIDADEFESVQANSIEAISILKEESAISLYGEEGKNGVILITMKKDRTTQE